MSGPQLVRRLAVDELFAAYVDVLDDADIARWPEMFTPDATYRVMSRENVVRGRPLATLSCEGRAAMVDRVQAVQSTSMYVPRVMRHVVSAVRVAVPDAGSPDLAHGPWVVTANVAVFETLPGELTTVFAAGRYEGRVVGDPEHDAGSEDGLRFAELTVVYDSTLIATSLVMPL